ncbi:lipoyl(octanoyl) transferase LipB [Stakelama tenebrarum]|uniref:Octanoyltransferase n=1 Tax=Stakelama tenebrarum TaxID=2711215 RepID=A0A6G6YB28_9SPHN|nr:lipoyl(octanoyl) transferase LipB [Sphingosinithalassobacter tenebrarum]QIG81786.1 lipoyl(octanoyl) transferase LipB [Sphingosinithalassobacter tenebrarum]
MEAVIQDIEWRVSADPIPYETALAEMEARAAAVVRGEARELIWLLEHPPVYTAGTSADPAELVDPRFPVVKSGRGGRYTYHGPGQRIGYLVLDLRKRQRDVRAFIHSVEDWVIAALDRMDIHAFSVPDRIGIWTRDGGEEAKIGAIGVRIRQWVTLHGFAVNLDPNLADFGGIIPCGIAEFPVTSAAELKKNHATEELDSALFATFLPFLDALDRPREKTTLEGPLRTD